MLDITLLRKDLDGVVARLQTRKNPQTWLDVDAFSALEAERKMLQTRTEDLQAQRNSLSKQIGMLKGKGDHAGADAVMAQVGGIKQTLEAAETRLKALQAEIEDILSGVPNLPHASVPMGADEKANVELRRWAPQGGLGANPLPLGFAAKDHVDLGAPLGLDFDAGAKLSGARFTVMRGPIARLHRALASSCWTCRRRSMATPSATRPTSSMPTACAAQDSCPNSRPIFSQREKAGRRVRNNPTTRPSTSFPPAKCR